MNQPQCRNCMKFPCYRMLQGDEPPCAGFVEARPSPGRVVLGWMLVAVAIALVAAALLCNRGTAADWGRIKAQWVEPDSAFYDGR